MMYAHADRGADQQPAAAAVPVQQHLFTGQHGQLGDGQPPQQTEGGHQDPRKC